MNQPNSADVAMAFVAKINAHDVDGLVALMTPGHLFIDALNSSFRGAEQIATAGNPILRVSGLRDRSDGRIRSRRQVAIFGKARGTFAANGKLARENFWEVPAAWRAVVKEGRVAEWQVYCDNEPARKIMAANTPAKLPENRALAAANEMHDLEAVVRLHFGLGPVGPRENIEILFDRDALALHSQMFQQRGNRHAVGYFAALAIDRHRHCAASAVGFSRGTASQSEFLLPPPALAWITSARSPFPSCGIGKRRCTRPAHRWCRRGSVFPGRLRSLLSLAPTCGWRSARRKISRSSETLPAVSQDPGFNSCTCMPPRRLPAPALPPKQFPHPARPTEALRSPRGAALPRGAAAPPLCACRSAPWP